MKKLPLGKAITQTYHYDAYPLSILAAHGDDYLDWLFSNYIQLNAYKDISEFNDVFLEFYGSQGLNSPFLHKQLVSWSTFLNLNVSIHDYIKHHIDQNYYLYFQIDEYYLPYRRPYMKFHFVHDLMIYGYDEEEKIYNIVGYNKEYLYEENTCFFVQFEEAFTNNYLNKVEDYSADRIVALKYDRNCKYAFNIDLVKHLLMEYLSGENTYETFNRYKSRDLERVYGINVYNKVLDHLSFVKKNQLAKTSCPYAILDNRIFRLIMEHKKMMMMRLNVLNTKGIDINNILHGYKEVESLAIKCHNMAIKYAINSNISLLDRLQNNIQCMVVKDQQILAKLVEKLA